jgi:hypothetical protein
MLATFIVLPVLSRFYSGNDSHRNCAPAAKRRQRRFLSSFSTSDWPRPFRSQFAPIEPALRRARKVFWYNFRQF